MSEESRTSLEEAWGLAREHECQSVARTDGVADIDIKFSALNMPSIMGVLMQGMHGPAFAEESNK